MGKNDRTVHPDLERFVAKRMGATTYEVDSSHVPMLSKPDVVLDVIRAAASAVSETPRRVNQLLLARHLISDTKQSDQNLDPFQSETLAGRPESEKADSWTFLILPKTASAKLPSRGMTAIEGTINGVPFQAELEPDGQKSHWLKVDRKLREAAGADAGDVVTPRDSAGGKTRNRRYRQI